MSTRMKRTFSWFSLFIVCLAAVLTLSTAFASTGPADPGDAAGNAVRETVLLAAFVALVAAAVILMRRITAKIGVEILVRNQDLREMIALRGIAYAEEHGYQALKLGNRLASPRKLGMAIDYVRDNLPALTNAQAAALVEGMLARVKGAGSCQVPPVAHQPAQARS